MKNNSLPQGEFKTGLIYSKYQIRLKWCNKYIPVGNNITDYVFVVFYW